MIRRYEPAHVVRQLILTTLFWTLHIGAAFTMPDTASDTIWHYTSMEAMLKIFRNRSLFFSNAAHLNDFHEISWVEEVFKNVASGDGTLDAKSMGLLSDCVVSREFAHRNAPYVASFSMQRDKLPQWRAYADDGKGIAIGFGRDWLMKNLDELYTDKGLTLFRQRVEYLNPTASCAEIYNALLRICAENRKRFLFQGDVHPIYSMANYFVKNATFEEEEEYRICYDANVRRPGAEAAGPTEQFRTAHDGRVVPYVEFDIDRGRSKLPVTGIVLGPRNVNSVDFMKHFLFKHGNLSPSIETSKCTYRR